MTDPDISARFDRLRGTLEPLDGAPAAIEAAVTRRRRRPALVGGAGIAAVAVAAAMLPGAVVGGPESTASFTTPGAAPPHAELAPAALTGRTVADWTAAADVVVVVSTSGDEAAAEVVDVSWRRSTQPDSPAANFSIDALELDGDGTLELATAQGARATATLSGGSAYLAALRWEQVRCDGAAPGWVLLGDDAVLPYEGAVVGPDADGEIELDSPVATAFAGLESREVARTLDALISEHGQRRAGGLCQ